MVARLGVGGMAVVYRVWDTVDEAWRAVKLLKREYASHPKLRKRFENEAWAMTRLRHRHIIRVFDVVLSAERPFIVMELAEGGCVSDWIEAHGAMPARMAVDVVLQAAKGLGAAHEMGVVHRDVKPHNLLISHRGVCRVTDFGIAHLDEGPSMTKTGVGMGTAGFMAPEQRSDSKSVDQRADVYGLGATLYMLLTGGVMADLFLAEHDQNLLDGVPDNLGPLVLRATAYKPEDRYDTVSELARLLHEARPKLGPIPLDTTELVMGHREDTLQPDDVEDLTRPAASEEEAARSKQRSLDLIAAAQRLAKEDAAARGEKQITEAGASNSFPSGGSGGSLLDSVGDLVMGVMGHPARFVVFAVLPLAILLMGGVMIGARDVHGAHSDAVSAREGFYEAIEAEQRAIVELSSLGADSSALHPLYREWSRTNEEPEKMQRAKKLISVMVSTLNELSGQQGVQQQHKAKAVRQRLDRLEAAQLAFENALSGWEHASDSTSGRLAIDVGLASEPPLAP